MSTVFMQIPKPIYVLYQYQSCLHNQFTINQYLDLKSLINYFLFQLSLLTIIFIQKKVLSFKFHYSN